MGIDQDRQGVVGSGLTKTDKEWSAALEAALTAMRRDDLEHGTNATYVAGLCL
jgi:hypothetical protein